MPDSLALVDRLQRIAVTGFASDAQPSSAQNDDDWQSDGLPRGQLHEVYAADPTDSACCAGFALAMAAAAHALPVLWLRTLSCMKRGGHPLGQGMVELGLPPSAILLVNLLDMRQSLRCAADAVRSTGFGTVLVESWGTAPELDLTVTRRLTLAAEASGTTVILLRIAAEPLPSAAATRWAVSAAPSLPLPMNAPGRPAFKVELLKWRGGAGSRHWHMEWIREANEFRRPTPLPGAGLSLASDRTTAGDAPAALRRTG